MIDKIAQFTRTLEVTEPEKVGDVIGNSKVESEDDTEKLKVLAEKVVKCLRYYLDVNNTKGNSTQRSKEKKKSSKKEAKEKDGNKKVNSQQQQQSSTAASTTPTTTPTTGATGPSNSDGVSLPSDTQKLEVTVTEIIVTSSGAFRIKSTMMIRINSALWLLITGRCVTGVHRGKCGSRDRHCKRQRRWGSQW